MKVISFFCINLSMIAGKAKIEYNKSGYLETILL